MKEGHPPFRPPSAVLLVFAYVVAFSVIESLGELFQEDDPKTRLLFGAAAKSVAPLIALYVGLIRYAPHEPTATALGLGRPRGAWRLLPIGALVGAALAPLAFELIARVIEWTALERTPEHVQEWQLAMAEPSTRLSQMVTAVLIIPIAEEAFFRGFMQPRLVALLGRRRALLLVAGLYAVVAVPPFETPAALLVGLPFGLLALFGAGTWPAVCASAAFSIAPMLFEAIGIVLPDLVAVSPGHLSPAVTIGCCATAVGGLGLGYLLRARNN